MATPAEKVAAGCPAPGEVPTGELWRLILQAWCGSTLEAICHRIGQHCDLAQAEIEATVLGLMNDSITTLSPPVREAFERALGSPAEVLATETRSDDMPRSPNGRPTVTAEPDPVMVMAEAADDPMTAEPPGDGEAELQATEGPRRRSWPFPCEEEGCDRGFETAQALRMHILRRHEAGGGHGWPRKPAGKADPLNERKVKILTAAQRSEDPETEALAVCARHITKLTEPEAKRVLEYLAQRFVVDAT